LNTEQKYGTPFVYTKYWVLRLASWYSGRDTGKIPTQCDDRLVIRHTVLHSCVIFNEIRFSVVLLADLSHKCTY